jgi:two-component system, OmpR family, KDP operon response regulator KdpE
MLEHPVLIVDDDESILEMIRMALETEGYAVVTAGNGRDALDLLGTVSPLLILLDMRMPRMNGWEFAAACDRGQTDRPPILVMTAASDAARSARDVSADGFLAKPFELDELLVKVKKYARNGTESANRAAR